MRPLTLIIATICMLILGSGFTENPLDVREPTSKHKKPSKLAELASHMRPGEWAELVTERPPQLMKVFTGYRKNGKKARYHIAGWSDDGHWDTKTGQFLFMGFRKQLKFIAYSEIDNKWRVIPGPFGWNTPGTGTFEDDRKGHFGHAYGGNALDVTGGVFYRYLAGYTYAYSLSDETWTRITGGNRMSMEYFPGLGLISHNTKGNGDGGYNVDIFDEKVGAWKVFTEVFFSGSHALARYNAKLDEMLLMGGSDNRAVIKIDRQGNATALKSVPFDITIREGKLLVDPNTGKYLIFQDGELHEFDSVKNEYRKIMQYHAPWSRYEMPVPTAIPEYGVIMFVDKKTLLYKHSSNK